MFAHGVCTFCVRSLFVIDCQSVCLVRFGCCVWVVVCCLCAACNQHADAGLLEKASQLYVFLFDKL